MRKCGIICVAFQWRNNYDTNWIFSKSKKSTYADGIKYKVSSTKPNSVDYHYEEDNFIYHDTYFGSKEFYGEEIVYFDNLPMWYIEYKCKDLNDETTDVYAKVLKPSLKNVDVKFPLRCSKEFIFTESHYYTMICI